MPALLEVDLWDRRKLFIINCDLGTEVAQLVKNPPAVWVTWVRSLGWEDPLEKGKLPTPVFWLGEFHGLYSPWPHRVGHN